MQVSVSMFDIRRQIDFDQDVDGQALAGFLDEWDLELPEDLASGTVAAEEVRGADLVRITGEIVSNGAGDYARLVAGE